MNYSKEIESFLNGLREAEKEYRWALEEESSKNTETQDLLHRLELEDDSYHNCAKIAKALKNVRQERRKAKDTVTKTEAVVKWCEENSGVIRSIEKLLGEVRKAERSTENRFYIPKTEIVENTLGIKEEK